MATQSISWDADLADKYTFKFNNDLSMEIENIEEDFVGINVSIRRKVSDKNITYKKTFWRNFIENPTDEKLDETIYQINIPNDYDDMTFYYLLCNAFATKTANNGSDDFGTIRFAFDGDASIHVDCNDADGKTHVFDIQLPPINA
jgi:hypothetical protein